MSTLEKSGYIVKSNNSTYELSLKFFMLGKLVQSRSGFISLIHPYLIELTNKTCEASHFVILEDNFNAVFVDKVDGKLSIRMDSKIGLKRMAHLTATGKVILAFSDKEIQNNYLANTPFPKITENTIINADDLKNSFNDIVENGYGCDNQESEIGLYCLAAPIFYSKQLLGAISISGPYDRMKSNKKKLISEIKETAKRLSSTLTIDRLQ